MKHVPSNKASRTVIAGIIALLAGLFSLPAEAQKKESSKTSKVAVKKVNAIVETPPKVEHNRPLKGKTIRVVLDPGHGGHDPGTLRSNKKFSHEKNIALEISQLVAKYIDENLENIELIHTRQADNFVSLEERVKLANSAEADFFVSIHCNASPRSWVSGTQVHIHDHAFVRSLELAKSIDEEFRVRARRPSRGIFNTKDRRHSLYVLQYTTMPSVLVEIGFLSNQEEERYLNEQYGKEIIASAIYRGLRNYLVAAGTGVRFKTGSPSSKKQLAEEKASSEKIRYRVQITASEKKIPMTHHDFKKLGMPIKEHLFEGETYRYRYTVGDAFDEITKATELMREVRKKGFPDAYLIIDPQQRAEAIKK
jgi:N-acetylmuramoyl-L-alanine amidase